MDWDAGFYVKLYRSQSPDWLALSPLTRGLFDELLLLADQAGRIALGKSGLPSIAIPLRGSWTELESHVRALLADGCLVEDEGVLIIPKFVEAQKRAKTSTERSRARRSQQGPRQETPAKTDATDATDATFGNDMQRDATACNGCNDKEQKEQKERSPLTPLGGSETEGADVGENPTESDLFKAYARGLSQALGILARPQRTDANAYALTALWGMFGATSGQTPAEFLAYLPERVGAYVADVRARRQPVGFESNYSPKRFLDWVHATNGGVDPFPRAPTALDGSPRGGSEGSRPKVSPSPYGALTADDLQKAGIAS